jgi:single-strand DNA-binding protein
MIHRERSDTRGDFFWACFEHQVFVDSNTFGKLLLRTIRHPAGASSSAGPWGLPRRAAPERNAMEERIEARGTVAREPEVRTTSQGKMFLRVTLAADDVVRGGERLEPEANKWHTVLVWGTDVVVGKGDRVFVTGQHVAREYTDKQGNPRVESEIHNAAVDVLERGKPAERTTIEVTGNVVRDPELKTTATGKLRTTVSIAANEVKVDGQEIDAAANKWHTAVFWGDQAQEHAAALKKGAPVRVSGDLVIREFEGRDGEMKKAAEIQRGTLEVLGPAKTATERDAARQQTTARDEELSR